MYIAQAAQMRELDRLTIESIGIPGMVLMENAGRGTVDFMAERFGSPRGKHVVIFVGPGNNGGDGFVIARTLLNRGACPLLYMLVPPSKLSGDALANYTVIKNIGLPHTILGSSGEVQEAYDHIIGRHRKNAVYTVVDALFGTGLAREVGGHFLDAIHCINSLKQQELIPIVAVDIPSGMNSDTGEIHGGVVQADMTVTYGLPKPAHFHNGGEGVGEVHVVDIGIPERLYRKVQIRGKALTEENIPVPAGKQLTAHKGTNGHLAVLAGSTGKTGAAILCAGSALHCGAGLVSLAVPENLNPIFEVSLPEAMTVPLKNSHSRLSIDDLETILEICEDKEAIVLGPGIGTDQATAELVLELYRRLPVPMVVDADALNILAARKGSLDNPEGPRILTPHPGEMARLCGLSVQQVQQDRLQTALRQSNGPSSHEVIIVLKGAGTVLASTYGCWAINTSGNPGMATGGMGDVLAGIIGSLLVQGYAPWDAACLGTFLHGFAADCLSRGRPYGYLASEVAGQLPVSIAELVNGCKKSGKFPGFLK